MIPVVLAPRTRVRVLHVPPVLSLRLDTGLILHSLSVGGYVVRLDAPAHYHVDGLHYDLPELAVPAADLEVIA